MNRKSKIIVSVVGITIVLLALLGITYAYYLTRIEGNTNTNSISVTTADLRLVYGDGNGIITARDIMPGTTIGEKTFTVKNTGKTKIDDYAVILEYAYFEDIIPSIFERPNDFEITLTCTSTKKDGSTGSCIGYAGKFNNENIVMTTNAIESEEIHSYSLTIFYANPNIDQSNDMGKNLNLKVDINRLSETTDIIGEITGVDESYSVRLNSEPKLSPILKTAENEYIYQFKGVPLGIHTLTVIDSEGEEVDSHKLVVQSGETATTGTKEITYVEEGTQVTATVPSITIKDDERVANITTAVNTVASTIQTTGEKISLFNIEDYNENSLAYHILNNRALVENYDEEGNSLGTTINTKIRPITLQVVELTKNGYDSGLYTVEDDDGRSFIYRGAIKNNYVDFAGFTWRIVRINGDGTIRLILDGTLEYVCGDINPTVCTKGNFGKKTDNAHVGFMYGLEDVTTDEERCLKLIDNTVTDLIDTYTTKETCENNGGTWTTTAYEATHANINSSTIKKRLESFYETFLQSYSAYLGDSIFCGDKSLYSGKGYGKENTYYSRYELYNDKTLTLKCSGKFSSYTVKENLTYPIALMNLDERYFAAQALEEETYLVDSTKLASFWWVLSPGAFLNDIVYRFYIKSGNTDGNYSVRPVINLRSDILLDEGDGTENNHYTVKLAS